MEKQITCRRCKGTGNVGGPVMNLGVPGGCFSCRNTGMVYTDKFIRQFGAEGEFVGLSWEFHGKMNKELTRGDLAKISADLIAGVKATVITEEQARKFFARYGTRTEV